MRKRKRQHEYVLTTHIDKGHIHNHIIFCAVNFVDYHKYNSNKRSYYGIRNMSDKLCRENGLSVVVPGKGSKGKSYAEYQAEKVGTSWKGKLKIAVDTLIPQVASFEELLQRLQAAGYEIKPGKYISCRAPGQERFTRLKTLGTDYTEEAIRERIEGKRTKAAKAPKEQRGVSLCGDMAVTKIKPIKSTLSKALDYIQNPDKTDGKTLVSSFGCSYETADIEFEYTLSQARRKEQPAFHLIQSLSRERWTVRKPMQSENSLPTQQQRDSTNTS